MKFLVDAQLPRRLAIRLTALGHEAIHTLDLPAGNRTSDSAICSHADATDSIVITKDADFVIKRTLYGSPRRLLLLATGNINNPALLQILEANLSALQPALQYGGLVELSRTSLILHD